MRILVAAAILAAGTGASVASDKDVENAEFLCSVLDSTGLASSQCEVSGWSSTVTTTVDMTSSEARKVCGQIAGMMRKQGRDFAGDWTLQIRSPYSGENNIAFCKL